MSRFREDGTHRTRRAGREVDPGKRAPYRDFLIEILTPTPDITLVEMSEALMENFGVSASLLGLLYYLLKHGDTYKKTSEGPRSGSGGCAASAHAMAQTERPHEARAAQAPIH